MEHALYLRKVFIHICAFLSMLEILYYYPLRNTTLSTAVITILCSVQTTNQQTNPLPLTPSNTLTQPYHHRRIFQFITCETTQKLNGKNTGKRGIATQTKGRHCSHRTTIIIHKRTAA